jgi:capsular exopolysaccharide synthesis family protein
VVTFTTPRSPAAEAYRTLRTNLQFAALDRPQRRILFASAGADEGKSTALANLAVVLAQAGTKVLIVDGDLRRPVQHTIFNLRNTNGLTNLFLHPPRGAQGGAPASEPDIPLQPTAVENLWLLASGPLPPNPAELLLSPRMTEILDRLAERADIVLIDAPPVVPFADAAVLSTKVDGVLLVVGIGSAKRDLARKARGQLEAVKAPVLGLVVTNVPFDAANFASYYDGSGDAAQAAS